MFLRCVSIILCIGLMACDDDSSSPGSEPETVDRALAQDFNLIQAPASTSAFEFIHETGVVTMEVWVDLSSLSSNPVTICSNRANDAEAGFWFGIEAPGGFPNHRLTLSITGPNGVNVAAASSSNGSVTFGSWQHFAVAFDGSNARFYINGNEETVAITSAGAGVAAPSGQDFTVGSTPGGSFPTQMLRAGLDELRIWSTARSAQEIADFGDAPLGSHGGIGLAGYWSFDSFEKLTDPSDGRDDLRDLTGTGAHLDVESETRLIPSGAFVVN